MAGTAFSGRKPKIKPVTSGKKTAPSEGFPVCPDWLDKDSAALFAHLSDELTKLGLLEALDTLALAQYCKAITDYKRYNQKIDALNAQEDSAGDIQQTENGYQHISIWHTLRNRAEKRADTLGKQFGLSPLARGALRDFIKPQDEGDEIEQKFFTA